MTLELPATTSGLKTSLRGKGLVQPSKKRRWGGALHLNFIIKYFKNEKYDMEKSADVVSDYAWWYDTLSATSLLNGCHLTTGTKMKHEKFSDEKQNECEVVFRKWFIF